MSYVPLTSMGISEKAEFFCWLLLSRNFSHLDLYTKFKSCCSDQSLLESSSSKGLCLGPGPWWGKRLCAPSLSLSALAFSLQRMRFPASSSEKCVLPLPTFPLPLHHPLHIPCEPQDCGSLSSSVLCLLALVITAKAGLRGPL